MVAPAWEAFQRPDDFQEQPQQSENIRQPINFNQQELEEELPGEMMDAETPEPDKPEWGNFKTPETYQGDIDPAEEENVFGYLVRNIAQNASRVGEMIVGRTGNLEKFGKDILSNFPEAGGLLGYAISELMGKDRWEQMIRGRLGQVYPTSENLQKATETLSGGYLAPKTEGEKKFQGVTKDISATIGGRGSAFRGAIGNFAINNLGIPLAANAVEEIVGDLGFGKDIATYFKLGAWSALSLLGNVSGSQYASQLMNEGRNGVPQNLLFDVPRMQNRLEQVSRSPRMLTADPRTALARQEIAAIQNDLSNGQTNVRSLMTTYDGINAAKRNRGMFEMNRDDQNFARAAIDEVRHTVRDEIMQSANAFPEALDNWRSGIQAWAVIHQSRGITNWVDGLAKGPYAKALGGPAAALFGVTAYGGLKAPIVALPAAVAIPAGYKTIQTAMRVWNDPNLSRYYWNAIANAKAENIPAFINNYNKLNNGLEKKEKSTSSNKNKKTNRN